MFSSTQQGSNKVVKTAPGSAERLLGSEVQTVAPGFSGANIQISEGTDQSRTDLTSTKFSFRFEVK